MRRLSSFLIFLLLCIALVAEPEAATPTRMNVQGRLTDSTGAPLPAGVKGLTFKIYNAATAGAEIWPGGAGEVHIVNTGSEGLWTALIGSSTPLTESVFSDTSRWLEVTVDDGVNPVTTLPRIRVVTGPYAYRVSTVDGASGGYITSKVAIGPKTSNSGAYAFAAGFANSADGDSSSVGGGAGNVASGTATVIDGGHDNFAGGRGAVIGGGGFNRARGYYAVLAGGGGATNADSNSANGWGATVGGGTQNHASGLFATVAGGGGNIAGATGCTIGGGGSNQAIGENATVAGGSTNTASGTGATVGGGHNNVADDWTATVPGGSDNRASGMNSFAAGSAAKAHHNGSMVLSATVSLNNWDSVYTSGSQQIILRAAGRFYLTTDSGKANIPAGDFMNTSTGAHLTTGGVWTNSSDANRKENFEPVDAADLVDKIALLPIAEWNYRDEDDAVRHIGPTAQDFYALFGLGTDDKSISTIDPAGIALAAIQELIKRNEDLESVIADQQVQIDKLCEQIEVPPAEQ